MTSAPASMSAIVSASETCVTLYSWVSPGRPAYQRTASKTSEHATLALQLRPMASACMDPPSARCDEAGNDGIDELGIRAPVCRTLINLLNAGGERALARGRRQLQQPRRYRASGVVSRRRARRRRRKRGPRARFSRRSSAARTSGAPTTRTFGVFQKRGAHQRRLSALFDHQNSDRLHGESR